MRWSSVEPGDPRLPTPVRRRVRPDVAHPVRHAGATRRPQRQRMVGATLRCQRELRRGGRGDRQVPQPCHPVRSGAGHLNRRRRSDLDVPLPGARSLSRQAGSGGRLRGQRSGDRRRTGRARCGPRRGHPTPTALRPTEVRGGRPVGPSDFTRYGALAAGDSSVRSTASHQRATDRNDG